MERFKSITIILLLTVALIAPAALAKAASVLLKISSIKSKILRQFELQV